jgi:hypothetical protein
MKKRGVSPVVATVLLIEAGSANSGSPQENDAVRNRITRINYN